MSPEALPSQDATWEEFTTGNFARNLGWPVLMTGESRRWLPVYSVFIGVCYLEVCPGDCRGNFAGRTMHGDLITQLLRYL